MAVFSFKANAEQERIVLDRMALAGETNRSAHVKRIYFQGPTGNDELIGQLRKQIDMLAGAVEQSQALLRKMAGAKTDDLELKLLAGLYLLLYPSVEKGIQATVDRHLDFAVIESFLTDNKRGKR